MSSSGCEPVRRFSWRTSQRHRPGLQYLVSTGRHHGFESLEEARLLSLDFAAGLLDLVSQPFRMRLWTGDGWRAHTPDFLMRTAAGTWLLAVRPVCRIKQDDVPGFAASAEAALAEGLWTKEWERVGGRPSPWTYFRVFGSWEPACEAADRRFGN
jgi:hypothetical protein